MPAAVLSSFSSQPTVSEPVSDARGQQVAVEEALKLLRDFLSHVGHNAASGDIQSASLTLLCLGEPPKQTQRVPQSTPNSPVAEVLHKMRTARKAKELRRARKDSACSIAESNGSTVGGERDVPEVFSTGAKSFNDRDLRQQVLLKVWDQARLRRWWDWHDRQMEDLKALKTVRRRQFLTNLRQHPWVAKPEAPQALPRPSDEEVRKLRRFHLLTKLRTSPDALDPVPQPSPAELSPEQRQANLLKRKESLSKLRSRSMSRPSSPSPSPLSPKSPLSPLAAPFVPRLPTPPPSFIFRTPEEHRKSLTGANSGSFTPRTSSPDFWAQWAAQETLVEQRESIRSAVDSVLYQSPMPQGMSKRLNAKRMWLEEDAAW
ncbi:hypothetical protein HK097_007877 [Rhizophlyctis rosea]|uniref:Uncharacterized protein n=1 Tax=Rhizophlyctis rosea TaxID=64517 RepID=A0AAD5X8K1_9FUNG|nr:hypothetical protein HK097_007877 [Rhizophlyctis rosea]